MDVKKSNAEAIANKIVRVKYLIDANKHLYKELDDLVLQLMDSVGTDCEVYVNEDVQVIGDNVLIIPSQVVKVVDNFKDNNVVFKSASIKRFDVQTETMVEKKQKIIKNAMK